MNILTKSGLYQFTSSQFGVGQVSKTTEMLNLFLISVFIGYEVGNGFSIVPPNNTAAISGQRLSLECSTTDNESFVREWTLKRALNSPGTNSDPQRIFSHWRNEAVYTISPNFSNFGAQVDASGSVVLYTNRSMTADAGLYTCVVEVKKAIITYSAQGVILQTAPHCEASFKADDILTIGERIWMRCIVSYRGVLTPIIQWRQHELNDDLKTDGKTVTEGIQTNTVASGNINYTLTINLKSAKDNIYISCKLSFLSHNSDNESKIATNAPEFSYTWNSPVIKGHSQTTPAIHVYAAGNQSTVLTQANAFANNWFLISLALGGGMLGVVLLMAIITTILCCRLKKRKMQLEKRRTAIESAAKSEKLEEILSPKAETSVPREPEIGDVMENDAYDKIGDAIENDTYDKIGEAIENDTYDKIDDVVEDGASKIDNQCPGNAPGYGNLLPPHKRETSTYCKIYHQDEPTYHERYLIGPAEVGQVESPLYLTNQESDLELASASNPSPYLSLIRDTGDVSPEVNPSTEYLIPLAGIQKENLQKN